MSNNISNEMQESILPSSLPSLNSETGYSTTSNGFFSSFPESIKNISLTTWIIIILILAFLGFNIFVYLAKGTQEFNSFFAPLITKITGIFGSVTGQVVDVSAEGAKAVVGTSAHAVNTGLDSVQNAIPTHSNDPKNYKTKHNSEPQPKVAQAKPKGQQDSKTKGQDVNTTFPQGDSNTVNKAINSTTAQKQQVNGEDYQADDSSSSIQMGAPKAGWCYIGEDRGFRTCAEVGVNDTCMSGSIFPSQQICVNPNLRS
jgi:hypothetical protein